MNKADLMGDEQFIFGSLMVVANRMDTLLERALKEFDITSKQWFLSIVVDNLFNEPPTMKEVAKEMGSSHQNVKQVALKLEQKGLIKLVKDKKDARVTRLKTSEKSYEFWQNTQPKGVEFIKSVFENINSDDLARARIVIQKMLSNLIEMENKNEEESD